MRAAIQVRRDRLQAEQERDELAYARLEEQIKTLQQGLALRQRQLDMRAGAIQALDEVLATADEPPRVVSLCERLIEYVRYPVKFGW